MKEDNRHTYIYSAPSYTANPVVKVTSSSNSQGTPVRDVDSSTIQIGDRVKLLRSNISPQKEGVIKEMQWHGNELLINIYWDVRKEHGIQTCTGLIKKDYAGPLLIYLEKH